MEFRRRKLDAAAMPFVVRQKWTGRKVLDEGFVPFPKRLLRVAKKLFKGDRRMSNLQAMLAIVDYERPTAARAASLKYLAFLAGLSTKSFRRSINDMKDLGWLKVEGKEDGLTIDYRGFVKAIEAATEEPDEDEK